jgi:hypothetical protein
MTNWHCTSHALELDRGTRFTVRDAVGFVTFGHALELLESSAKFRDCLSQTIARTKYPKIRWETPPVTIQSLDRSFEFVLMNSSDLGESPEPEVFREYFESQPIEVQVLAVPNLGRTARLIVPREMVSAENYAHFKIFLCGAPKEQIHELWRCVAYTAKQELSNQPLWISTAGGGVNWLHVRLEHEPKYYSYRPFANAA